MENLSEKELITIGGGAAPGENTGSIGISLTATADSLLNITLTRNYGSYHSSTTLSAGNNIGLNLGLIGQKQ